MVQHCANVIQMFYVYSVGATGDIGGVYKHAGQHGRQTWPLLTRGVTVIGRKWDKCGPHFPEVKASRDGSHQLNDRHELRLSNRKCKDKQQSLLNWKVSSYCCLLLHGRWYHLYNGSSFMEMTQQRTNTFPENAMLDQCWNSVEDGSPTLVQLRAVFTVCPSKALCFLVLNQKNQEGHRLHPQRTISTTLCARMRWFTFSPTWPTTWSGWKLLIFVQFKIKHLHISMSEHTFRSQ